jgi:hypothetical protein
LFARWNVAQAPTGFAEIGSDDFHSSPNLIFFCFLLVIF